MSHFPEVRQISKVAQHILEQRYFYNGEKYWEELVNRVLANIVGEDVDEDTQDMILNRYFIPNSPCLVNAGKPNAGLNACYVVDFLDDIEEIYKTKLEFAKVARKGGGCGTSLSHIRPEGSVVAGSAHGYAGGPLKFANTISVDMDAITQAGFRSMAIMFTMSVYHPDILKFIKAKHTEGLIANANISVVVDDDFMRAVKNDKTYWTEFGGKVYKELRARDVFDMVVDGAWRNGEPGMLFQDAIDRSPYAFTGQRIDATNPCAEQPLPPNGVCNLGSLDVSKFVVNGHFDFVNFERAVGIAVEFLDSVIDKSAYPTEEIEKWAKNNRPIGLGIMGFADLCLMFGVAYGSEDSIDLLTTILSRLEDVAISKSNELGKILGVPEECRNLPIPRRNITVNTIAPTGTVSLIAGCTSGIEPIFSEIVVRNDKTGTFKFATELARKPYFRCAVSTEDPKREVTWEEHIRVLAAAQEHIQSGVSKTINFPQNTHRETISKGFMMAWEMGCKGLAVYRNNSRQVEVLSPKNVIKDKCPLCDADVVKTEAGKKCTKCNWNLK